MSDWKEAFAKDLVQTKGADGKFAVVHRVQMRLQRERDLLVAELTAWRTIEQSGNAHLVVCSTDECPIRRTADRLHALYSGSVGTRIGDGTLHVCRGLEVIPWSYAADCLCGLEPPHPRIAYHYVETCKLCAKPSAHVFGAVRAICKEATDDFGATSEQVAARLDMDAEEARQALRGLASRGHLFTTVDEDHFAITDADAL